MTHVLEYGDSPDTAAYNALNPGCLTCGESIAPRRSRDSLPANYHAGCRPAAGRIAYRAPSVDRSDAFDTGDEAQS